VFWGVSERLGVRCCRDLEALTRLRNLLVHKYWAVKDEIVYSVEEFIERVRELVLR